MNNFKRAVKNKKGMTYIELIVVLSIFSVISSVVIFNYGGFQERVDIKNLSTDIALKIVEAQKASLSGRLPSRAVAASWKPAYGVFLDVVPSSENKKFINFVDTDSDGIFDGTDCTAECLSRVSITKGNYISQIRAYLTNGNTPLLNDLTVSFIRPDSGARIISGGALVANLSRVEVTVASPDGATSRIVVYPSGRIEVK
jgi:prepilin-type N-terminal cleavage/methylation domain-containing protein